MKKYDMIIIGAGPSGLTMAHCCSKVCKNILIIDKENVIGGCHRVKRINGLFTEHGPRIYLENYVNFFALLFEMKLKKEHLFTSYNFYDNKLISEFSLKEIIIFLFYYIIYIVNDNYGKNINMYSFCKNNNFSIKAIDVIDRLCRIIDGANIHKFSLNKMFQSFDIIFGALQPKQPLDKSLFNNWKRYLELNNVDFILNSEISNIGKINNNLTNLKVNNEIIYFDKLILAVPPACIVKILDKNPSIQNAFGNLNDFKEWVEKTEYIEYISITYHYENKLNLDKKHGVTIDTDWGIVVINLTDYMQNIENKYKSIISVAITITDKPSKFTNKTANQSTKEELILETYRQIKSSLYFNIPETYYAILNPNNYFDKNENKWLSVDEAYFNTVNTKYLPNNSKTLSNIYNVGVQNGHSFIEYTTLESAVCNAIVLSQKIYPQLKKIYSLKRHIKLKELILVILIIMVITFFIVYLIFNIK